MAGRSPNMEQFEAYFQRADVDRDGRISGGEAVTFLQASNLPRQVLAQIWTYADQNRIGFLGRPEFYNALKLVTVAQSKQDLTPELVKAAFYGPASARIPAPQINLAVLPAPQSNSTLGPSTAQSLGLPISTQGMGAGGPQGPLTQQSQASRPPRPPPPNSGFQSQLGVSTQGKPRMGSMPASHHPNSFDSLGRSADGPRAGISTQVSNRNLIPSTTEGGFDSMAWSTTQSKALEVSSFLYSASSKPNDAALLSSKVEEDFKSLSAAGNGFASDSAFGDVFSATTHQPPNTSTAVTYHTGSTSASLAGNLSPSGDQPTVKARAVFQSSAIPAEHFQSTGKANQHDIAPKSSALPVATGQSQSPWPRMTQLDVQKYSKVFVQVDTDRDGKITGEQARNLFLSWRLPQEILKQVWDLSDQDNDSMLSLREFCIALYLMERYREGHPLPKTLPNSVMLDEMLLPASAQPASAYGTTSWRPTPGFQQTQGTKDARPITSAGGGKPPRPIPVPQPDEPIQQRAKVPLLEKHVLDQLSTEEQDSLNKKFQEAKDSEKKVADLEKNILEARQKIQFYNAKMQELILYKSRCDNRLNEISERVVADKREAELLAKKYEENYKQAGDIASKLTLEEATFRDIQEKKIEVYQLIFKLELENADGIKDRANEIQSDIDELVKALNDRCKTYGLRGKPTSLVELPFGWQPGIAAAAADWDEVWDKFEDEGFAFVKELTLEVQNVIAPPKPKSVLIREKITSLDNGESVESSSKADEKSELASSGERVPENDKMNTHNLEQTARSPSDSPAGRNAVLSPSKEFQDLRETNDMNVNGSPHAFDIRSKYGAESVLTGDRGFDEPSWGSFDIHYDFDAAGDFYPANSMETEHERHGSSLFGGDDWGLNPIRTGSKGTDTSLPKQGPFFDSVPSTPLSYSANSPLADNFFMRNSPFTFAESVPSTPMRNSTTSPRRFSEGSEEQHSLDSFSRFDSFNLHDNGPFSSRDSFARFDSFNMNDSGPLGSRETLARFDSMQSTRDSDFDQGYFAPKDSYSRFDSFRSTADSDYNFGLFPPREMLTRFDSMHSTKDSDSGHGFASFNDAADPFGSSGPFKASHDVPTPWKEDAKYPFGSSEPFKTLREAQTPRGDSDSWKAF